MSDLEELERERGNKEYMEDAKAGAAVIAPVMWLRFSVWWWRWHIVKQWAENTIDELVNQCYTIHIKQLKRKN